MTRTTHSAQRLRRRCALLSAPSPRGAQSVTAEQLNAPLGADPERWLHYSGDYSGQRHSPLTQITPGNVGQLLPQWAFQTGVLGKFETTPLVIDGILYVTGPNNTAWALDARTGRQIWRYSRELPEGLNVCCGRVNRGFAALGNRLYMTTLDAHLLAFDMKTGAIVWDVVIDDYKRGYTATAAPLIVKDKVIVGIAGAEYGIRGFIDAFDAATGKKAWRFWTVPGPGEKGSETWEGDSWKRGGGSTWVTGTYDPALNLVYWGTGNPGPDLYGDDRDGDNLYTDAVVALDPDTGTLKWHYQFTPHDVHDWDATQVPVLADVTINGVPPQDAARRQPQRVLLHARSHGGRAARVAVLRQNDVGGEDRRRRPTCGARPEPIRASRAPTSAPTSPAAPTGCRRRSIPNTGLLYVTAREVCATYYGWEQEFVEGAVLLRRRRAAGRRIAGYGALRAIDPKVAGAKWQFRYHTPSMAGVLSTESGVVFGGDMDGNVMAFDAASGKNLWYFQTGSADLRGADHLHARRPPVRADAVGDDAVRVCASAATVSRRCSTGSARWPQGASSRWTPPQSCRSEASSSFPARRRPTGWIGWPTHTPPPWRRRPATTSGSAALRRG